MQRFISWDQIDVRVDGAKLNALAASFRVDPIERMELQFFNGLLRIAGTIRKFISVPFTVDIREIRPSGHTVSVPISSASAFGALPIPQFLFGLVRNQLPVDLVRYEDPATFVVSLERFLPSFIDADIQKIWIIDGGLAVTLGRGGADFPPSSEENHGRDT
ncbi:MAG TPA: hypothetical protein VF713_23655 [Thermoanaerobaculia bacterium]